MLALTPGKSQDLPFPPIMLMMELTDNHARNQTQVFKKNGKNKYEWQPNSILFFKC